MRSPATTTPLSPAEQNLVGELGGRMQRVASGWRAPHALVVNPSATYHVGTAPTSDHPDGRSALQETRAYMRIGQGHSAHLLHHTRVLQARQAHRQPPSRPHLQRRCLDIADLCAAATGSQLMPQADRCLRWSTAQWTGCRLHTLSDQHVLAHKAVHAMSVSGRRYASLMPVSAFGSRASAADHMRSWVPGLGRL